jgi:hypothetical protein
MNIKIDQVFSAHFPSPFASTARVLRQVSFSHQRTRKPFDLSILTQDMQNSTRFELWIKTLKLKVIEEELAAEKKLAELLKTPIPLQSFELTYQYKSNKTTYQAPINFWHDGETAAPSNPLMLDTLLYERVKEELYKIIPHKKGILPFQLKLKGRLFMNQFGYFYLKLKDSLFEGLQKNIRSFGGERPPYLTPASTLGYHLGVIMPSEYHANKLWGKVKEVGREFYFAIDGCYQVHLHDHPKFEMLWVMKASSPQLEALRGKYGLQAKQNGHDFMIVLGVKKRQKSNPAQKGFMRINPSIYPM